MAECDEQRPACHDRRQDQRQVHHGVEQELSRKAPAREKPRESVGQGQRRDRRDTAHFDRQGDDFPFLGREHDYLLEPWRAGKP